MADFDVNALQSMPLETLKELATNTLGVLSSDKSKEISKDELIHLIRFKFDPTYSKESEVLSKEQKKVKSTEEKNSSKSRNVKRNTNSKSKSKSDKESEIRNDEVNDTNKSLEQRETEVSSTSVTGKSGKKVTRKTVVSKKEASSDKSLSKTKKLGRPSRASKEKVLDGKDADSDVLTNEILPLEEMLNDKEEIDSDKKTTKSPKKTSLKSKKKSDKSKDKTDNIKVDNEGVEGESSVVNEKLESPKEELVKKKRGRKPKVSKEEVAIVNLEESADESTETVAVNETESSVEDKEKLPSVKKMTAKRRISFGPGKETKVESTNVDVLESPLVEKLEPTGIIVVEDKEVLPEPVQEEIQLIPVEGVLSIGGDKGDFCGFIHAHNYLPGESDSYVPGQFIRRYGLRKGDYIKGLANPARGKGNPPLKQILSVNEIDITAEGFDMEIIRKRPKFEHLTAIYPNEKLVLESGKNQFSTRIIDMLCPIGKGQRGMVVSPPKAGKTVLLKKIANAITVNNPRCKLIVLLIDERPEEVTDMQRSIDGEVVYSTFDKKPENHVRVTELVLERAMRLVELGEDVVILLDSMTRLARAYNLTITPTGRTLSGGLDPGSLYGPKRFFGAARNIENGGSLTIISTSLIETGSRMDEVIFEEFKGTGNMEVVLDRKLADRRVFPAIAVDKSGTRREDLLLTPEELDAVWKLRKRIADFDTVVATDLVIKLMDKTPNNKVFVDTVIKKFADET